MLALLAAITVAFGTHPAHAGAVNGDAHYAGDHHETESQPPSSHSHFGAACLQAELDNSSPGIKGSGPVGHADCSQVFAPLLRPAFTAPPTYVFVAIAAPHDLTFRQLITSFDPPPPRHR